MHRAVSLRGARTHARAQPDAKARGSEFVLCYLSGGCRGNAITVACMPMPCLSLIFDQCPFSQLLRHHRLAVTSICFSPSGCKLVSADAEKVLVWNSISWELIESAMRPVGRTGEFEPGEEDAAAAVGRGGGQQPGRGRSAVGSGSLRRRDGRLDGENLLLGDEYRVTLASEFPTFRKGRQK